MPEWRIEAGSHGGDSAYDLNPVRIAPGFRVVDPPRRINFQTADGSVVSIRRDITPPRQFLGMTFLALTETDHDYLRYWLSSGQVFDLGTGGAYDYLYSVTVSGEVNWEFFRGQRNEFGQVFIGQFTCDLIEVM